MAAYRGTWLDVFRQRFPEALYMETMVFAFYLIWRAGGMMLLGILAGWVSAFTVGRAIGLPI